MITTNRLNAYKIMWLFVFFDLPTNTKTERKKASRFRKDLEKDGFTMMQFSVYIRHCPSKENMEVHIKRIKSFVPDVGLTSILSVTDKQYGDIINLWGKIEHSLPNTPVQLELF
jgi:CRISPR-associated protein Cas2